MTLSLLKKLNALMIAATVGVALCLIGGIVTAYHDHQTTEQLKATAQPIAVPAVSP
jgi:sensor histidine kinase regulating citrate/malate metabolism